MEQILPPPLPPKARCTKLPSPPAATVLTTTAQDIFCSRLSNTTNEADLPNHVVNIQIPAANNTQNEFQVRPCIISVNTPTNMVQSVPEHNFYFYTNMSSGQISPSDTLDSGTCSDLDASPPPPLPKKKQVVPAAKSVTVTIIGEQRKRPSSLTSSSAEGDSDNDSNVSYDSLNGTVKMTPSASQALPQGLLQDIRTLKLNKHQSTVPTPQSLIEEPRKLIHHEVENKKNLEFSSDMFYKFHLHENVIEDDLVSIKSVVEDETFAGYKDLLGDNNGASTIRSAKGTVRGVKNRVRAGIATFLQINSTTKSYKEKEAGKVIVYTTTMGILRDTYQACMKVKQILRTLLVKYEERDVFMSTEYQAEIKERMRCEHILVPQVFVDGQHVGDAETIERLNECGELRRILKPFRSMDVCIPCKTCGGYRLLPCTVCNGSKKSVHRNDFTAEFVALKCMNCDEVGLVKCSTCS